MKNWLILVFLIICSGIAFAQDESKSNKKRKTKAENLTLENDTTAKLELKPLEEKDIRFTEVETNKKRNKKEKKSKKVYFGIKTNGGMVRSESSSEATMELFRVIETKYLLKNVYQREIYYFDLKTRKIRSDNYTDFTNKLNKGQRMFLLHGYYQKIRNKEVRDEGYFYKGLKHSKWMEFDKEGIVLEKIKYNMGITEQTIINYYDEAETKIKEIIPIVHGRKQGKYSMYYENGLLAMEGNYENNEKIGLWREWYENRQRKKDTQYTYQWWDKKEPFMLREWDNKGKMVYDIDRGGKLKN